MKFRSFAVVAATMIFALAVSAAPTPQDAGAASPNIKSTEVGGNGGDPFDDTSSLPADITKVNRIIIQGGERVDSIQLNLSGATGDVNLVHGGGGGNDRQTIDLAAGQKITKLVVWSSGDKITGMRVGTSNPAVERFVGTRVGNPIPILPPPGPSEFEIVGFFGRSGAGIDRIGAIWRPIANTATAAATATPTPTAAAATATPTPTDAPTATATPTPTDAPTATATPTPTDAPTATATATPTDATATPTATPTGLPTLNVGGVIGPERSFDVKDPEFGGVNGTVFDGTTDATNLKMNRFIVMASANRVEQVQANFRGTNADGSVGDQNKGAGIERLNTPGVDRKTIELTEGEMVNSLNIQVDRTTRNVIGLTMGTTKNQIFSTGSQQGEAKAFLPPSSDFGLIGFTGRADPEGIVSLGPIWGVLPIGQPAAAAPV